MARRKRTMIHQHITHTYVNRIPLIVFAALIFVIGALGITLLASRVTIHKLRAQASRSKNGWVEIEPSRSMPESFIPPGPTQHEINCAQESR